MKTFVACLAVGITCLHIGLRANCAEQEPSIDKISFRKPLVLVPCGRGVDSRVREKLNATTSSLQNFILHSNMYIGSNTSNDWMAVVKGVRELDMTGFVDSTNRLDYMDVASFYEAVVMVACIMAKKSADEAVMMLTSTFDAAIQLAEHDPMRRTSGFGVAKNFQAYRYGQSDGRPEMLRIWEEEGKAFRDMVRYCLLPRWRQIIQRPEIQSALNELSVTQKTSILREINRISDRIQKLAHLPDIQDLQTADLPTNAIMKAP